MRPDGGVSDPFGHQFEGGDEWEAEQRGHQNEALGMAGTRLDHEDRRDGGGAGDEEGVGESFGGTGGLVGEGLDGDEFHWGKGNSPLAGFIGGFYFRLPVWSCRQV